MTTILPVEEWHNDIRQVLHGVLPVKGIVTVVDSYLRQKWLVDLCVLQDLAHWWGGGHNGWSDGEGHMVHLGVVTGRHNWLSEVFMSLEKDCRSSVFWEDAPFDTWLSSKDGGRACSGWWSPIMIRSRAKAPFHHYSYAVEVDEVVPDPQPPRLFRIQGENDESFSLFDWIVGLGLLPFGVMGKNPECQCPVQWPTLQLVGIDKDTGGSVWDVL